MGKRGSSKGSFASGSKGVHLSPSGLLPFPPNDAGLFHGPSDISQLDAFFGDDDPGFDDDEDSLMDDDPRFDPGWPGDEDFCDLGWDDPLAGPPSLAQRIRRGALKWAPKSLGLRQRFGFLGPMDLEDPLDLGFVSSTASSSSGLPGLAGMAASVALSSSAGSTSSGSKPPVASQQQTGSKNITDNQQIDSKIVKGQKSKMQATAGAAAPPSDLAAGLASAAASKKSTAASVEAKAASALGDKVSVAVADSRAATRSTAKDAGTSVASLSVSKSQMQATAEATAPPSDLAAGHASAKASKASTAASVEAKAASALGDKVSVSVAESRAATHSTAKDAGTSVASLSVSKSQMQATAEATAPPSDVAAASKQSTGASLEAKAASAMGDKVPAPIVECGTASRSIANDADTAVASPSVITLTESMPAESLTVSGPSASSAEVEPDVKSEEEEKPAVKRPRKTTKGSKTTGVDGKLKGKLPKPKLPFFAFEWFKEKSKPADSEEEADLSELLQKWKLLSQEEKQTFIRMADEDRQRFEGEYEAWRLKRSELGKVEPTHKELLEKRKNTLEKALEKLDRAKRAKTNTQTKRKRQSATKIPEGFPLAPEKSAYSLFCKEQKSDVRTAVLADAGDVADSADGGAQVAGDADQKTDADRPKPKVGMKVLGALRRSWSELPSEERAQYERRVAEDQERFRSELDAWRQQQPNEGLGTEAVFEEAERLLNKRQRNSSSILSRLARCRSEKPSVPNDDERQAVQKPKDRSKQTMFDVFAGTESLVFQDQRSRRFTQKEEIATKQSAAGQALRGEVTEGGGAPLEDKQPEVSVDDLLGDLMMVEADQAGQGALPGEDHGIDAGELGTEGNEFEEFGFSSGPASGWSDVPQASGEPKALGPQLCLDEAGNLVLDPSSLSRSVGEHQDPVEAGGPVHEAVSQYSSAYKRTKSTKWTLEETNMFYEALSLYGTDLFLVQTFFRNKSAADIKTKYSKELKKSPAKVEEALTTRSRKLTKETFEKLHGKIDTSKHYKPPPSPLPGEAADPDGALPGEADDDDDLPDFGDSMPPPQPEYSAEDESLTTNRLMALFD
eukprot:TRINITY_DN3943_c0_g1_i2.p1 TRINITY_DN3943_c0_g1~~TRINITY_DN3943_c0_g1_i2.p1  ORF type:complete len:1078 (-),score=263.54 TRINITY_DN3943_c0_g1_i2:37-3270(-)